MASGMVYSPISSLVRKGLDPKLMTVDSILTYPGEDLAGDIVHPNGGIWTDRPYINFNHGDRDAKNGEPHIGHGDVSIVFDQEAGELPLGTSHFNQSDRVAVQVFRLVEADAMTGVSMEFKPIPGHVHDRGFQSVLEGREAREFKQWKGLGWAHCWVPINPNARTLAPEVEKCIRIAEVGRIGSEPLADVIRKSLTPFTQIQRSKAVPVSRPVEKKAMADEMIDPTNQPEPVIADGADVAEADAIAMEEDVTPPTAKAAYAIAQMASDMAEQAKTDLKSGEHTKGKKKLKKIIKQCEKLAEEASAIGDMVVADVSSDDDDEEVEEDSEIEEESDDDGEEVEVDEESETEEVGDDEEYDDEGEEKGIRIVPLKKGIDGSLITKSGFKPPRRIKMSELSAVKKGTPKKSAADLALEREFLAIQEKVNKNAATLAKAKK